ncbi:hypothetical protein Glove_183g78 [Diversispora epigaea]|uniref:Uncharacterized protein n=1 Tax=Diversispora epigaea TaxID=1348612 RepID=A0A397IU27_9GLOM|nr:hypothetical protein Glove_183g78 [Diversispora epigaea]
MAISLSYGLDKHPLFPAPISPQTLKSLSRNAALKRLLKGNRVRTEPLSFSTASIWYRAPFGILPPTPVHSLLLQLPSVVFTDILFFRNMAISLSYGLDKRPLFPAPISPQTFKFFSRNAALKRLLKGNRARTGPLSFTPASIWYRAPFGILPPTPVQQGIYLTDYSVRQYKKQITHPYNSNSTLPFQLTSHTPVLPQFITSHTVTTILPLSTNVPPQKFNLTTNHPT